MKKRKQRSPNGIDFKAAKKLVRDRNDATDLLQLQTGMYVAKRHNRVIRECGRRGITKRHELARYLKVSTSVLHKWFRTIKEFRRAYFKGIDEASIEIEQALVKRAKGYNVPVKETRVEDHPTFGKKTVVTRTVHHVAGDVAAQKFFLRNRAAKRWNVDKGIPTKTMNLDIHLDASDKEA